MIVVSRVAAEAFPSVTNMLGGKSVLGVEPQLSLDWVEIIRDGIRRRQ